MRQEIWNFPWLILSQASVRTWSNEGLKFVLRVCSVDQIYYPDILLQISSTVAFGP